jgi:hypothetical protein
VWHARDGEYVPHRSKLLHYTGHPSATLATNAAPLCLPAQPRRPGLVRSGACCRCRRVSNLHCRAPKRTVQNFMHADPSAYESTYTRGELPAKEHLSTPEQQTVSWYDLVSLSETGRSMRPITDVVSTEVLDSLPDEDVPWVLDELFRSARRKVAADRHNGSTDERVSSRQYTCLSPRAPSPGGWHSLKLRVAITQRDTGSSSCIRAIAGATRHAVMRRRPSL